MNLTLIVHLIIFINIIEICHITAGARTRTDETSRIQINVQTERYRQTYFGGLGLTKLKKKKRKKFENMMVEYARVDTPNSVSIECKLYEQGNVKKRRERPRKFNKKAQVLNPKCGESKTRSITLSYEMVWTSSASIDLGNIVSNFRNWLNSIEGRKDIATSMQDMNICVKSVREPMANNTDTMIPTTKPTNSPTSNPTYFPTKAPTSKPTPMPTLSPTGSPTGSPTSTPTIFPTVSPTFVASVSSSQTETPTKAPTFIASQIPINPNTTKFPTFLVSSSLTTFITTTGSQVETIVQTTTATSL